MFRGWVASLGLAGGRPRQGAGAGGGGAPVHATCGRRGGRAAALWLLLLCWWISACGARSRAGLHLLALSARPCTVCTVHAATPSTHQPCPFLPSPMPRTGACHSPLPAPLSFSRPAHTHYPHHCHRCHTLRCNDAAKEMLLAPPRPPLRPTTPHPTAPHPTPSHPKCTAAVTLQGRPLLHQPLPARTSALPAGGAPGRSGVADQHGAAGGGSAGRAAGGAEPPLAILTCTLMQGSTHIT